MCYRSEYYAKDGTIQVHCSRIFEEQYQEIKQMAKTLIAAMNEMDYFVIVLDSIKDFLNDCSTNGIGIEKNFIRANRYLLNWLSSFYTWIEYHENNFKVTFTNLKKKYYDQSFSYRFAYNLRKYMTHCSLGITKISYDAINEKQSIQIIPLNILETEKGTLQVRVRQELEEMINNNTCIDAINLTKDFTEVFKNFQKDIWQSQENEINNALIYISQFVPLNAPECYNCVITSNDKSQYLSIGQTLENYTRKIQLISNCND